jgi:hypothetical protein
MKSRSHYVYNLMKREEILRFFHKIYCISHKILTLNTDQYPKKRNRTHFVMEIKYILFDFWTEMVHLNFVTVILQFRKSQYLYIVYTLHTNWITL